MVKLTFTKTQNMNSILQEIYCGKFNFMFYKILLNIELIKKILTLNGIILIEKKIFIKFEWNFLSLWLFNIYTIQYYSFEYTSVFVPNLFLNKIFTISFEKLIKIKWQRAIA